MARPDFTLADADLSEVTIRRLLSRTAGVPDPVDWLGEYQDESLRDDEAALHDYVHSLGDQALTSQPGTEWAYVGDQVANPHSLGRSADESVGLLRRPAAKGED